MVKILRTISDKKKLKHYELFTAWTSLRQAKCEGQKQKKIRIKKHEIVKEYNVC